MDKKNPLSVCGVRVGFLQDEIRGPWLSSKKVIGRYVENLLDQSLLAVKQGFRWVTISTIILILYPRQCTTMRVIYVAEG